MSLDTIVMQGPSISTELTIPGDQEPINMDLLVAPVILVSDLSLGPAGSITNPGGAISNQGDNLLSLGNDGLLFVPKVQPTDKFVQLSPLATWVINHNLGYRPHVSVYSVGGVLMLVEVLHASDDQVQVLFDSPTAGYAIYK